MKDTTKKIKALSDLSKKDSEIRYRRLFEAAQVGILILDSGTGMIQDVNPYLIKMLGYSRKEFIKKKLWEVGAFKDIEASQDAFEALQKNDYIRYEDLPLKAKDGRVIQVEFVSNVYQVGDEKVIQCNIRNITKHNRAEEKIQDLEKFPAESPYPILRIGQDGTLLYINVAGSSQLPDWHLHVGQEVPPILKEVVVKSMNNRTTQAIDLEYGERVYAFFVVPIVVSNYTNVYGLDITERKRMEKELLESEDKLIALIDNTTDTIWSIDTEYRLTSTNVTFRDALARFIGREISNGESVFTGVPQAIADEWKPLYARALGGETFTYVGIAHGGWRGSVHHETFFNPIRWQDDNVVGVACFSHDITERKRAEDALGQTKDQLEAILHAIADGVTVLDASGWLVYANDVVAQAAGYPSAEEMLRNYDPAQSVKQYDLVDEAGAPFLATQLPNRLLQDGKPTQPVTVGFRLRTTGKVRWSVVQARPVFDEQGKVQFVVTVMHDITERKRMEEALRESEERYRTFIESTGDSVFVKDIEFRYIMVNKAAQEYFGKTEVEIIGKSGFDLMPQQIAETCRKTDLQALEQNGVVISEEPIDEKIYETRKFPIRLKDGKIGVGGLMRDISERKRAEEALKIRENMLQKIFDILPVGLWIADKDGKLLRGNPAGVKIWGAEPKVSLSKYGVFKGRLLPSREEIAPDDWALVHTIRDKVTIVDELLEIDAFDGKKKTILNFTAPVLDDQGDVQGAIVVNQDITERKRAETELARSHDQMRALTLYWQAAIEAERAHISHEIHDEFGQSMTALKMDLAWLAARLPEGDEKIDRIRGMNTLVDNSITLMRRIATDLRPALLDDLGLNAALEWQAGQFSKHSGIPCKLNLPKDDLALDPALNTTLFRIFQETLTNITRHAQATRVSASLKQKGHTLVLTLRDNGRGISESELEDPRSLGLLGLRERAAQWGGETTLRGTTGKGTTVTVHIPLPATPVNGGRL